MRYDINRFIELAKKGMADKASVVFGNKLDGLKKNSNIWNNRMVKNIVEVRVITNAPIDKKISGWKIVELNKQLTMKNHYVTVYQSENGSHVRFFDEMRSDKETRRKIEWMNPGLVSNRVTKNADFDTRPKKRVNYTASSTSPGKVVSTKYEYPDDCKTKEQRAKYRREMRKKGKK